MRIVIELRWLGELCAGCPGDPVGPSGNGLNPGRSGADAVEYETISPAHRGDGWRKSGWRDKPCKSYWRSLEGFAPASSGPIDIVERALEIHGAPIFVRHEIVHNKHVVERLRAKGARFVEEVEDIPEGAVTVFSAHGVARKVVDDAGVQRAARSSMPPVRS